jgi:hypothetical protein
MFVPLDRRKSHMFGPIYAFNFESRQALFAATMEAATQLNPQERMAARFAAALARSPSLAVFITKEAVDLAKLSTALNSVSPANQDPFEALQRVMQAQPRSHQSEESGDDQEMPASGFVGVQMSPEVRAFFEHLNEKFAEAPGESVSPSEVLLALLDFNSEVADVFKANGFHISALRDFIRNHGAA